MSTSAAELHQWYQRGQDQPKRYMVIATDTFNYDDYPVYTDDPHAEVERLRAKSMTKVMEVYDLQRPFQWHGLAWHMPTK